MNECYTGLPSFSFSFSLSPVGTYRIVLYRIVSYRIVSYRILSSYRSLLRFFCTP
jgi:hypothetical protein